MAEEFLTKSPTDTQPHPTEPLTGEHREPVRVILVGSRLGVLAVVHWLIRLGFTQMADWSNWQSVPNSRKWMR
ncbi:MAG TPA: hypothetical protein IGS17_19020, partial [Oscillatoriales cyanobacterium M59_W2019_021]